MARTDVWYQCTECRARGRGDDGRLFCGDCGGELHRIGYIQHGTTPPTAEQKTQRAREKAWAQRQSVATVVAKRDPKRWMW